MYRGAVAVVESVDVEGPGDRDSGDVLCVRGEWSAERAVLVVPFEVVVMERGCEGEEE